MRDSEKIKDLFNRSYSRLDEAIKLLAIFIKYKTNKVSYKIVKSEFKLLGINYGTYMKLGRTATNEIFQRLGLFEVNIKRQRLKGAEWSLDGDANIKDSFIKLQQIYRDLTGKEPKNLDNFISSDKTETKSWEEIKSEKENMKKILGISREESDDRKWQKWLLLEALKERLGANSSIESLIGWIKTTRYTEINKDNAIRLYREMQEDSGCIKFAPGNCISWKSDAINTLFKFYDPRKITESVFVKVRLTPDEMRTIFPGLSFNIDENLGEGKYIYRLIIDRSYQTELYLKKLLELVKISGSIYTKSFMISRVSKILEKENADKVTRDNNLIILEKF